MTCIMRSSNQALITGHSRVCICIGVRQVNCVLNRILFKSVQYNTNRCIIGGAAHIQAAKTTAENGNAVTAVTPNSTENVSAKQQVLEDTQPPATAAASDEQADETRKLSKRERKEERRKLKHKPQKKEKRAASAAVDNMDDAVCKKKKKRKRDANDDAEDDEAIQNGRAAEDGL